MSNPDVRPVLKRFDVFIYKSRGGGDVTLIPAEATANVTIYPQSAVCSTTTSIPIAGSPPTILPVFSTAGIVAPGTVQKGLSAGAWPLLYVDYVDQGGSTITVRNSLPVVFSVTALDRLVVVSPPAYFYLEPLGTDANPPQMLTVESLINGTSTGHVRAYIRDRRFDFLVSVGGTTRWCLDWEGGFVMRG